MHLASCVVLLSAMTGGSKVPDACWIALDLLHLPLLLPFLLLLQIGSLHATVPADDAVSVDDAFVGARRYFCSASSAAVHRVQKVWARMNILIYVQTERKACRWQCSSRELRLEVGITAAPNAGCSFCLQRP